MSTPSFTSRMLRPTAADASTNAALFFAIYEGANGDGGAASGGAEDGEFQSHMALQLFKRRSGRWKSVAPRQEERFNVKAKH